MFSLLLHNTARHVRSSSLKLCRSCILRWQVETGNITCDVVNASTWIATNVSAVASTSAPAPEPLCLDLEAYAQATAYTFFAFAGLTFVGVPFSAARGRLRLAYVGAEQERIDAGLPPLQAPPPPAFDVAGMPKLQS